MELNHSNGWNSWKKQNTGMSEAQLKRLWEASDSYKADYQPDESAGWASLQNRMAAQPTAKVRRLSTGAILLRIAAGLLLLAVGVAVFRGQISNENKLETIVKTTEGTKEINLSDGSVVALNRSSQLNYESTFTENERRVELVGEAFFKVARDESKPFIIKAGDATVQVLGTAFNVRAYPNDDVFEVFVESGKVKVDVANADQHVVLTKGQFFKFDKSSQKAISGVDKTGVPIAWRAGIINFKGQPISVVLEGMGRLYGVDFELKTVQNLDCLQTLTVQKDGLEEAIAALKTSCPKLKFNENSVGDYVVSGLCCE